MSTTSDYKSKLTPSTSYGVKIGIAVTTAYWPAFFDILAWNAIHEDGPFFQIVCIAFIISDSETCPTTYGFSNQLNKSLARMQQDFETKSSTKGYDYTPPTSDTAGKLSGKGGALTDEVTVLKITGNDMSSLANYGADLFITLTDSDIFSSDSSNKMTTFPRIMGSNSITGSEHYRIVPDISIKEYWIENDCYKFVLSSPLLCLMQWLRNNDYFVSDKNLPNGPSKILNIRNNNIDLNIEFSNNYDPLFVNAETDMKAADETFPEARRQISCINIKSTSSTLKTSANDSLYFLLKNPENLDTIYKENFIKQANSTDTADSVIKISSAKYSEYSPENSGQKYYLCQLEYKVNYTRYYPYTLAASIASVNDYAKKQTTTS